MLRRIVLIALASLTLPLSLPASEPQANDDLLRRLWPEHIKMPEGLRLYKKTQHSQRLVILNGQDDTRPVHNQQDDVFANAPTKPNPNRLFPWATSGGLHNATGWQSYAAVALPDDRPILWWWERIAAGASRPLPRIAWRFPVGTVFADLLVKDDELFELRTLTRTESGWVGRVLYETADKPAGYTDPGKVQLMDSPHLRRIGFRPTSSDRCMRCHNHAGGWLEYGVTLRGSDKIFSFPLLRNGTLTPDASTWWLHHWN